MYDVVLVCRRGEKQTHVLKQLYCKDTSIELCTYDERDPTRSFSDKCEGCGYGKHYDILVSREYPYETKSAKVCKLHVLNCIEHKQG